MAFYNIHDIELDNQIEIIKEELNKALDIIRECEKDDNSEYSTKHLKRDIERFLKDYC